MDKNNANKADILGMPFGTAQNRLRKKLLFHLAGKLGMLECFRCHEAIENLEDFSIEHTRSWLNANDPVEAFFNVEGIAFSHLDCNVRAGVQASSDKTRIISPEGMSWCSNCKKHLSLENFIQGNRYNGLRQICRKCYNIHRQEYRRRTGRH